MRSLISIALLTFKAGFRYRLVQVLAFLLLMAVVLLPLIIKGDGTARGFTQILLTYTLSSITAILGFATLWLACGSLAREIEECQMQMVVVKPVAHWQIWLGKWLGILWINGLLISIAAVLVFGILMYRSWQLPPEQQQVLRNEVLVARGVIKEVVPDFEPQVEELYKRRLRESVVAEGDRKLLKDQIREIVKATFQIVKPQFARRWIIDLGNKKDALKDKPLFLKVKFTVTDKSTIDTPKPYATHWQVGVPETRKVWRRTMTLASETYHQIQIPPNLYDDNGRIVIECINIAEKDFLFMLDDGLQLLYPESGFGVNYFRGICILFFWIALLAAVGLAAASFLSFPVAAFFSVGFLVICFSTGTLSQIVQEGGISGVNHDTGFIETPKAIDHVVVPISKGILSLVNLVREFSPIDSLSTGRSITWLELGKAFIQIVVLMSGIFALFGITCFSRREMAAAQANQ